MPESKECFRCKETKLLSEFYKHPRMKDGCLGKCKVCAARDVRENRKTKLDYYRKYEHVRNKNGDRRKARLLASRKEKAEHPERTKLRQERYHQINPGRKRVTNAVNNAVRDGRLKKPSVCERCGAGGRIEGHHEDYTKPLVVEWLCKICHGETYSKRGMI